MTHAVEPKLVAAKRRVWKILREFPDYEISNDGRLRRLTAGSNTKIGRAIRVGLSFGRYPKYGLSKPDGTRVYRTAHRLVAAEFLPPQPPGKPMILHRDDNLLNCVWLNLRWGNDKDNSDDAHKNGRCKVGIYHPSAAKPWTRTRGADHASSKLTDTDVRNILCDDRRQKDIADAYGVDPALIYRIRARKVWKHITDPTYARMLQARGSNQ